MSDTVGSRHLDGAMHNLEKMSEYVQTGKTEVIEVGIELLENKIENSGMDKLQECIGGLIRAEQRVKAFTHSVDSLKSRWQNGELEDSMDIVEELEADFKRETEKVTNDPSLWDHEFMTSFIEQMKTIDAGFEFNTGVKPRGDDDVMQMAGEATTTCPITQCQMADPVKDKICGHSFEKQAILAHIAQCQKRKRPAKCPSTGCTNIIDRNNLESNVALKQLIQRRVKDSNQPQSSV
nr:E3 SUMO-protein ligase NSE2 [Ciona intestinalis]|eukprot:XP_002126230.1 E3 SUMO-protein ligase NSE2 [Ciona intestinalis]